MKKKNPAKKKLIKKPINKKMKTAPKAKKVAKKDQVKPATKSRPKKMTPKMASSDAGRSASAKIDQRIKELGDWRGQTLSEIRNLIKAEDPDVVETWKWMGVPVWEHDGIITTGETYKAVVKLTFPKGASLKDPAKLFNSSLEGNARRAIDFKEGDPINATALKALIREAIHLNQAKKKK